jgi:hypothetical protein
MAFVSHVCSFVLAAAHRRLFASFCIGGAGYASPVALTVGSWTDGLVGPTEEGQSTGSKTYPGLGALTRMSCGSKNVVGRGL